MFGWFKKDKSQEKAVTKWYASIMSKAREPEPFVKGLVNDTLDGRFHMVTLVSTLVMRRLRDFGDQGRELADGVYKRVFSGFDHALREEGVGDSSIARKVRKMGEEFFGIARAIDAAFEVQDPQAEIQTVLTRNMQPDPDKAAELSKWLLQVEADLRAIGEDKLLTGAADLSNAQMQG